MKERPEKGVSGNSGRSKVLSGKQASCALWGLSLVSPQESMGEFSHIFWMTALSALETQVMLEMLRLR